MEKSGSYFISNKYYTQYLCYLCTSYHTYTEFPLFKHYRLPCNNGYSMPEKKCCNYVNSRFICCSYLSLSAIAAHPLKLTCSLQMILVIFHLDLRAVHWSFVYPFIVISYRFTITGYSAQRLIRIKMGPECSKSLLFVCFFHILVVSVVILWLLIVCENTLQIRYGICF